MDAFLGITLSFLVIRWYWKHVTAKRSHKKAYISDMPVPNNPVTKAYVDENPQRQKEIADLKRQGYTDELIAVIIPTINNGQ